jgi:hypothetical protein
MTLRLAIFAILPALRFLEFSMRSTLFANRIGNLYKTYISEAVISKIIQYLVRKVTISVSLFTDVRESLIRLVFIERISAGTATLLKKYLALNNLRIFLVKLDDLFEY